MAHDEAARALRDYVAPSAAPFEEALAIEEEAERWADYLESLPPSPLLTRDVLPDECDEDPGDDPLDEPSWDDVVRAALLRVVNSRMSPADDADGRGLTYRVFAADLEEIKRALHPETDEQKARRVLGEFLVDHPRWMWDPEYEFDDGNSVTLWNPDTDETYSDDNPNRWLAIIATVKKALEGGCYEQGN